jgi:predicted ester cyclase
MTSSRQYCWKIPSCLLVRSSSSVKVISNKCYNYTMTLQETNKTIVRRFYEEVWNQNKLEVIDELFAADYAVENMPSWRKPGASGLKEFIDDNHRMFPDVHHTIDLIIAEGDNVAVYLKATATHKGDLNGPVGFVAATGKAVHWDAASFFHIQNGKIVKTRGVVNNISLMQQLGAVRMPAR